MVGDCQIGSECLMPGSPDALTRRGPLRSVRASWPGTRLKQAARAFQVVAVVPVPCAGGRGATLAGGVHEAGLVTARRARPSVVDEVAGGYRPAGDVLPPPLPFAGRLGWLLSGQQVVPAQQAAPVLPGEQAQGVPVERGPDLLAPLGPVAGQGGVIGGCRALDRHVPFDAGPGELDQVGAAVAVAEHPAVVPELVELAEVPAETC